MNKTQSQPGRVHHLCYLFARLKSALPTAHGACEYRCNRKERRLPRPLHRPRRPSYAIDQAVAELCARDAKLAGLIQRAGPFTLKLASSLSPFEALLQSIVYQQLHGKAAAAIHSRLIASFSDSGDARGGGDLDQLAGLLPHPTPQQLLDCPTEQLRAAGLSRNKTLAIRDLAARTIDGTVPTLARIRRMDDEAIIEHLSAVRGIGRWTAEMMLIFRLGRPDVLPVSDYGVRKGFALTFGKLRPADKVTPADLPRPDTMHARARRWHPWCSVASWYLWRACDLAASDLAAASEAARANAKGKPKTKAKPKARATGE